MSDATTPPATEPAKNWFARLDPAVRALLVLVLSAAITIGWQKLFPGVPAPTLTVPQQQAPSVLVLNVGQPAAVAPPIQVAGK